MLGADAEHPRLTLEPAPVALMHRDRSHPARVVCELVRELDEVGSFGGADPRGLGGHLREELAAQPDPRLEVALLPQLIDRLDNLAVRRARREQVAGVAVQVDGGAARPDSDRDYHW